MSGQALAIAIGCFMLVFGAVVSTFVQALFRRNESTGKRIGALEKEADFQRGYRDGVRAGREEANREGNAK